MTRMFWTGLNGTEFVSGIGKWMEGRSFCPVKKINARLNRQPAEQETVLVRCTSDTRLISRIDKQLQNWDTPKLCQSTSQASKEETQVVNKNSKATTYPPGTCKIKRLWNSVSSQSDWPSFRSQELRKTKGILLAAFFLIAPPKIGLMHSRNFLTIGDTPLTQISVLIHSSAALGEQPGCVSLLVMEQSSCLFWKTQKLLGGSWKDRAFLDKMWGKRSPYSLLLGMGASKGTMEASVEFMELLCDPDATLLGIYSWASMLVATLSTEARNGVSLDAHLYVSR